MNDQFHIKESDNEKDDSRLESLLNLCQPEEIDNSRIKSLVYEKIRNHERNRRMIRRRWLTAAVGVAACVAIVFGIFNFRFATDLPDLAHASLAEVEKSGYKELRTSAGERVELTLEDGTHLVANSKTRILYPEKFAKGERLIYAEGEVYLEVSKDKRRPFIVKSKGFEVKVLGTVFNVNNTSDTTAQVVLVEGAVEVITDKDNHIRMKPNDMVSLENDEITQLTTVDAGEYVLWVNGILAVQGETLEALANRLSDYFGVKIRCESSLADHKVYGKLDLHGNVDSVIKSLGDIIPMTIEKDGEMIIMKRK